MKIYCWLLHRTDTLWRMIDSPYTHSITVYCYILQTIYNGWMQYPTKFIKTVCYTPYTTATLYKHYLKDDWSTIHCHIMHTNTLWRLIDPPYKRLKRLLHPTALKRSLTAPTYKHLKKANLVTWLLQPTNTWSKHTAPFHNFLPKLNDNLRTRLLRGKSPFHSILEDPFSDQH